VTPSADIVDRVQAAGIVAVITLTDGATAVPLARSLLAGGIQAIELTLRTPAALQALEAICKDVPDMLVGAGTVLNEQQVDAVKSAGVDFAVSPGMNPAVVKAAQQAGLPFAPGICTPTDIEASLEFGCRLLKFFPAEHCGGLSYLNSIAAPYAHLGIRFLPLGGVNVNNAADYLASPHVAAVGGSWLAPSELIADNNWTAITQRAHAASELIAARDSLKA